MKRKKGLKRWSMLFPCNFRFTIHHSPLTTHDSRFTTHDSRLTIPDSNFLILVIWFLVLLRSNGTLLNRPPGTSKTYLKARTGTFRPGKGNRTLLVLRVSSAFHSYICKLLPAVHPPICICRIFRKDEAVSPD